MTTKPSVDQLDVDIAHMERWLDGTALIYQANGTPAPALWGEFALDELVEIKGRTYRVRYVGETAVLFEPARLTGR